MEQFDVVIIGSGPGGYIAAIRAAQLGFKTACIEKDKTLGGTCLNVGCIPSKALLESSHFYRRTTKEAAVHGIIPEKVKLDLKTMIERKNKVVAQMTGGVEFLFKKNKITSFKGHGQFNTAAGAPGYRQIAVKDSSGKESIIEAKHTIIATGSVPSSIPGVTIDEKRVVSSTGALDFTEVPKKLVVIGGGYIGLELGSVWARLGSEVHVVEFMDKIIPLMDESLSSGLKRVLEKQELNFHMKTAVQLVQAKTDGVEITVKSGDKTEVMKADKVLVSVGRKPYTENLGLEKIGIVADKRGFLTVDENFQTSVKGIYAIGDVIGGLMLAHKAEEEGVACAELLAGEKPKVNYRLVPGILYTHPEVASVGYTEGELKMKGVAYKKGQFNLKANGRAVSIGETEGFVKILTNEKTDEVLGAHIIAPNASEMIHEFCVAMEFGATAEDIALTMHGHPTLSESIKEAALNIHGRSLNS